VGAACVTWWTDELDVPGGVASISKQRATSRLCWLVLCWGHGGRADTWEVGGGCTNGSSAKIGVSAGRRKVEVRTMGGAGACSRAMQHAAACLQSLAAPRLAATPAQAAPC
jgi:hypothetical protein